MSKSVLDAYRQGIEQGRQQERERLKAQSKAIVDTIRDMWEMGCITELDNITGIIEEGFDILDKLEGDKNGDTNTDKSN